MLIIGLALVIVPAAGAVFLVLLIGIYAAKALAAGFTVALVIMIPVFVVGMVYIWQPYIHPALLKAFQALLDKDFN